MLGAAAVSCLIAAAPADSAFCWIVLVSESYWRCVSSWATATGVESGSCSTFRCVVSSGAVGSSAWLNSARTVIESMNVALFAFPHDTVPKREERDVAARIEGHQRR